MARRAADPRREAMRAKYAAVADLPHGQFAYPTGRHGLALHGYAEDLPGDLAEAVIERFVGVGNPFSVHRPGAGERVLDIGCGAGLDVFVAGSMVGDGLAVGIDSSQAMLAHGFRAARAAAGRVAFFAADVEALPFGDGTFDVVVSNGVLNLALDKDAAFREIARVLRPGGRLACADLLVEETVPAEVLADPAAWST